MYHVHAELSNRPGWNRPRRPSVRNRTTDLQDHMDPRPHGPDPADPRGPAGARGHAFRALGRGAGGAGDQHSSGRGWRPAWSSGSEVDEHDTPGRPGWGRRGYGEGEPVSPWVPALSTGMALLSGGIMVVVSTW